MNDCMNDVLNDLFEPKVLALFVLILIHVQIYLKTGKNNSIFFCVITIKIGGKEETHCNNKLQTEVNFKSNNDTISLFLLYIQK